jgi:hypothetical protein
MREMRYEPVTPRPKMNRAYASVSEVAPVSMGVNVTTEGEPEPGREVAVDQPLDLSPHYIEPGKPLPWWRDGWRIFGVAGLAALVALAMAVLFSSLAGARDWRQEGPADRSPDARRDPPRAPLRDGEGRFTGTVERLPDDGGFRVQDHRGATEGFLRRGVDGSLYWTDREGRRR